MHEIRRINAAISIGLLDLPVFAKKFDIGEKRTLEKRGTLYLLGKLLETEGFELLYTPQNKPFIKSAGYHISISHSHDKLAIISDAAKSTGIDIELIREKVIDIRHKFLSQVEQDFAGDNVELLITMWAVKESMYKAYGMKGIDFSRNLLVKPFSGNTINGYLILNGLTKSWTLQKEKIDNYIMAYILDEIQ